MYSKLRNDASESRYRFVYSKFDLAWFDYDLKLAYSLMWYSKSMVTVFYFSTFYTYV
jgi:hypothetical protein